MTKDTQYLLFKLFSFIVVGFLVYETFSTFFSGVLGTSPASVATSTFDTKKQASLLVDSWVSPLEDGTLVTMTFAADGTGIILAGDKKENFSYAVQGNQFELTLKDKKESHSFSILGDVLLVDGEKPGLKRKNPKPKTAEEIDHLVGTWSATSDQYELTLSFAKDKSCSMTVNKASSKGSYHIEGQKVVLNLPPDRTISFIFHIQDGKLILENGDTILDRQK